jgi:hypothetical protein
MGTKAIASDVTYGVIECLYLSGVASTDPGDVVTYNVKTGVTTRAVHGGATCTGQVAVAMSTCLAGMFGWYAVNGAVPVKAATVAADLPMYMTSTAGQVDDAVVGGDKIAGMVSRAATSSSFATCQLSYPAISADDDAALDATQRIDIDATVLVANAAATKASILKLTLTQEAEVGQTFEIEGQVEDLAGLDAATARQVFVRSYAVTDAKGAITIGIGANPGTLVKATAPAAGPCSAWITTTAAGHFRFIITNDVAETNYVEVSTNGAVTQNLKLTFT